METRANHVVVGAVTLALLAMLAAFIMWIVRIGEGDQKRYDIFFQQSVAGLAKGTQVAYSGVPVGQVEQIELWEQDPNFIRVRINVAEDVPILVGTTATIQSSFTGMSNIQLEGGKKGAPSITEPGPEGVPVIPTKAGGLGAILNNAPLLLERLATLTERLNVLLSDENQQSIRGILANTDRLTAQLANASPEVKETMQDLQATLEQATATLAAFEGVAEQANQLLGEEGSSLAGDLRATLRSAKQAAAELEGAIHDTRPALRQISGSTLPAAEAAIRELRTTSRALRSLTEKIDEQGASAVLGGQKLPEYAP